MTYRVFQFQAGKPSIKITIPMMLKEAQAICKRMNESLQEQFPNMTVQEAHYFVQRSN